MRLWHKDLIPYLPRQQLIAQWRECCAICSNWANKGTPNHLLVNKIMDYPIQDFIFYSNIVKVQILNRGYNVSEKSKNNFYINSQKIKCIRDNNNKPMFENWHNERYLKQCLFNLQEKYDCGGISKEEWKKIEEKFGELLK